MLYTVMPMELVLSEQVPSAEWRLIDCHGRLVWGEVVAPGRLRIERLCSSNPRDFLDPQFTPGSEVPIP